MPLCIDLDGVHGIFLEVWAGAVLLFIILSGATAITQAQCGPDDRSVKATIVKSKSSPKGTKLWLILSYMFLQCVAILSLFLFNLWFHLAFILATTDIDGDGEVDAASVLLRSSSLGCVWSGILVL